jgi:oligopeptidase B
MTTPMRIYDFDMKINKRTLIKSQKIPSGHNKSDYITKRIHAKSADGERIPISLIYHKNNKINGKSPCLLYGYGAYGISIPASFSSSRLSLVDRNFVYAVAHIRGGKDCGSAWYNDGKKENKINTFNDFICVAEYLCNENYASKGNIIAHGGSAGGMLMGAVANMAPSLFSGIIAEVPFVDVLETMLDSELPLTPPEWPEWGNPIINIDDYKIISSYSPYDNIKKQPYPHILATAGLTDPRVTYWEPAKWVAKIRSEKTNKSAIMLNVNMDSGHGGSSGRFDRIKEIALIYAFAIKAANAKTK